MPVLVVIIVLVFARWLFFRESKEDRRVREVREAQQAQTERLRLADEAKQQAEQQKLRQEREHTQREISEIRASLHASPLPVDVVKLIGRDADKLEYAHKAWRSYICQSLGRKHKPHQGYYKFPTVERFGHPASAPEARNAGERVLLAARVAVIPKLTTHARKVKS